ncbi:MAG: hypothetical protein ACXVNO_00115 [Bacteroidia bacterium]
MEKSSYWQILLKKWREEGNDGLTLPFIIGSKSKLTKGQEKQTIKELITDIIVNEEDTFYIKYCMNVEAIIIGVWDTTKTNNAGQFLNSAGIAQNKLFITKFLVDEWKSDLQVGIQDLEDRYGDKINMGDYSINQRVWGPYNASDLNFIDRCIAEMR